MELQELHEQWTLEILDREHAEQREREEQWHLENLDHERVGEAQDAVPVRQRCDRRRLLEERDRRRRFPSDPRLYASGE